jgi:hypothetical protein
VGTLHALPSRDPGRELVPLGAALRHQTRYLAARRRWNNDVVDAEVVARHTVARSPVGPRNITVLTRQPRAPWDPEPDEVGHMDYRICDRCRLGMVLNISTSDGWKRRGYATWMIDRSRRFAPATLGPPAGSCPTPGRSGTS